MKLSEILSEDNIVPELKAKDKKGVLEELSEVISNFEPSLDKSSLVKILLDRERLGSTGIGDGVAIPHGKFPGISTPIISFGRSRKGLDFQSMDGQPVYLFFLLVAPEDAAANVHLKTLARIAKIIKNSAFRNLLMESTTRSEIYQTIIQDDDDI